MGIVVAPKQQHVRKENVVLTVSVPAKVKSSIATGQTRTVNVRAGVPVKKGIAQRTQLSEYKSLGVLVPAKVKSSIAWLQVWV